MHQRIDKVKFENLFVAKSCDDVRQLAKPLQKQGIKHFSYLASHGDNAFELLTTHAGFSQLYLENKFHEKYFAGAPEKYISCYSFTDDIGCQEVEQAMAQYDDIGYGLVIIRKHQNKSETFFFGASAHNHAIRSFYLNNLHWLNQYIDAFKDYAAPVLKESAKHKLIYPPTTNDQTHLTSKEWQEQYLKVASTADIFDLGVHLTHREKSTANLLLKGFSCKEIASFFDISPRTVEKFIAALKRKLNCRTRAQLLCKLLASR